MLVRQDLPLVKPGWLFLAVSSWGRKRLSAGFVPSPLQMLRRG